MFKMTEIIERYPHVAEQIFKELDNKSLSKCREVAKSWKDLIDRRNYPWTRIVTGKILKGTRYPYLHLAVETGQQDMFKKILDESEYEHDSGWKTPFHTGVFYGHPWIVEALLESSIMDKNPIDSDKRTLLHIACMFGHTDIADKLLKKSVEMKIDVHAKDTFGKRAIDYARSGANKDLVNLFGITIEQLYSESGGYMISEHFHNYWGEDGSEHNWTIGKLISQCIYPETAEKWELTNSLVVVTESETFPGAVEATGEWAHNLNFRL